MDPKSIIFSLQRLKEIPKNGSYMCMLKAVCPKSMAKDVFSSWKDAKSASIILV